MKTFGRFLLFVFAFALIFGLLSTTFKQMSGEDDSRLGNIAVIEIEGVITESLPVLEQIREIRDNSQIKAVVVRVNSPGGAVGASQEIYLELKKLRGDLPVIVSMGDIAASGGLYVALGAERVIALPGTLTGSMGVLFQLTNFSKLLEKALIEPVTIRSGELKDAGNPTRPMDPKAKKLFEDLVKQTFESFKASVAAERKLQPKAVDTLSDGRIVNGDQAKALGLIDDVGTFQDAVDWAKQKANIKEKVQLAFVSRKPKSWFEKIFESEVHSLKQEVKQMFFSKPMIEYRWNVQQ